MSGIITINPLVFADKRDAMAVALNEALRLFMEDQGFVPRFVVTSEQRSLFKGTAYADDEDALKKTIVARVATFDTSVTPTPEQVSSATELLAQAARSLGETHRDIPLLRKLGEALASRPPVKPTGAPKATSRGTSNDDMLGGDVASWGHALDKIPAPVGTPPSLVRINGSAKGEGYFGRIPYRSRDPRDYMTEQSIDSATDLKPLLVPTLTPDEIVAVATPGARIPDSAYQKADAHAAARLASGKPVFALPSEKKELHPGLIEMMRALPRPK